MDSQGTTVDGNDSQQQPSPGSSSGSESAEDKTRFNTPFALNATVLALEGVPNLGPVNSGIRLPEHHATSPDTSRPETEDALETFEQSPNAEWVFSCSV